MGSRKRLYAAYGSNLDTSQMAWRCPSAKVAGTGEIRGYELLFKGSGTGSYLTIERAKGGHVPVAVWEVDAADEAALDAYEGFPTFYYKKEFTIPVTTEGGDVRAARCFAYVMHEDRPCGSPSPAYVATCLRGYGEFGFDGGLIYDAIERSAR